MKEFTMPNRRTSLPTGTHQLILRAAVHPDHQVASDAKHGQLLMLESEGLAHVRPILGRRWGVAELDSPLLHLSARGRAYAAAHGTPAPRRRVVLVPRPGQLPHPPPPDEEADPAAHRYLRACLEAARALTRERGQIFEICQRAGLLPEHAHAGCARHLASRTLAPTSFGHQAEAAGLQDAEVVLLGPGGYCSLVRRALPDVLTPLVLRGPVQEQLKYCEALTVSQHARREVWTAAAQRMRRGFRRGLDCACGGLHGRINAAELEGGDVVVLGGAERQVTRTTLTAAGLLVHTRPTLPRPPVLHAEAGIDMRRPRSRGAEVRRCDRPAGLASMPPEQTPQHSR
jgi:hypothetical protein